MQSGIEEGREGRTREDQPAREQKVEWCRKGENEGGGKPVGEYGRRPVRAAPPQRRGTSQEDGVRVRQEANRLSKIQPFDQGEKAEADTPETKRKEAGASD